MFKTYRLSPRLSFSLLLVITALFFAQGTAFASPKATPTLEISITGSSADPNGHVGTAVTITGSGFTANNSVSLYLTSNEGIKSCKTGTAVPGTFTPFSTPHATANASGIISVNTTWPTTANLEGQGYYICAWSSTEAAASSKPFTVVGPASIHIIPAQANPGKTVTIMGENWYPTQPMIMSVTSVDGKSVLTNPVEIPVSQNGDFQYQLKIPDEAPAGAYTVSMRPKAGTEPALTKDFPTSPVTVIVPSTTPINSTPNATVTTTETTTAAASPTATATNTDGGSNNTLFTVLTYVLGGLGIILVIIGITVYTIYARRKV